MTSQSLPATVATLEPIMLPTRRWRWAAAADPKILDRLAWVEDICLVLSSGIAILVLSGWLMPFIGPLLFKNWMLMKANTAVMILFASSSLALSRSGKRFCTPEFKLVSSILAAVVLLVAASVLVEYLYGISTGMDTLLAADSASLNAGRMSPQTASAFVLLGIVLLFIRVTGRAAALVIDLLVLGLGALVIFVATGYAFGVMKFFGVSPATRMSPYTLSALMLLTFVVFSRRAEAGFYSVLAGSGIYSKIARMAAPLALVSPIGLEAVRFGLSRIGLLSPKSATALVAAMATIAGFVVILLFAWHVYSLEREIRELSMRDELTRLYNRRGFFLMAEVQLRLARHAGIPFSVFFLDLDGLKHVNDTLGHEAGSEFLKEVAVILNMCFRETDVSGRIGGDEFVVAAVASASGIAQITSRLQKLVGDRNTEPGRAYALQFSLGVATLDEDRPESLEAIVKRADEAMYLIKRRKEQSR